MMINVYVDGKNFGKEKGSAYAVILTSVGVESGTPKRYERYYDADDVTTNEAAIYATIYALHCVKPGQRKLEVVLHTNNPYLISMLEKEKNGEWKKNSRKNKEVIDSLRKIAIQFPNLSIQKKSKDKEFKNVQNLAYDAANSKA
jgi:ribonuclease HI